MSKLKLGLQMWSIHDVFVNQGFEKALQEMSKMGYEGLEFALGGSATLSDRCGYPVDPKELKKMMEAYGVEPLGSHIAFGEFMKNPEVVLQECLDLGLKYAAVGPAFEGTVPPTGIRSKNISRLQKVPGSLKRTGFSSRCTVRCTVTCTITRAVLPTRA